MKRGPPEDGRPTRRSSEGGRDEHERSAPPPGCRFPGAVGRRRDGGALHPQHPALALPASPGDRHPGGPRRSRAVVARHRPDRQYGCSPTPANRTCSPPSGCSRPTPPGRIACWNSLPRPNTATRPSLSAVRRAAGGSATPRTVPTACLRPFSARRTPSDRSRSDGRTGCAPDRPRSTCCCSRPPTTCAARCRTRSRSGPICGRLRRASRVSGLLPR